MVVPVGAAPVDVVLGVDPADGAQARGAVSEDGDDCHHRPQDAGRGGGPDAARVLDRVEDAARRRDGNAVRNALGR
ncbi:hypothetical protein AYO27_14750 [Rhizobium sp. GHKF11]|nr:hypothetical protein AYO27_14750 [Rhizobium sp. GHKF11]